jgi:hypothetical protein
MCSSGKQCVVLIGLCSGNCMNTLGQVRIAMLMQMSKHESAKACGLLQQYCYVLVGLQKARLKMRSIERKLSVV